jgi:hypothetical protein
MNLLNLSFLNGLLFPAILLASTPELMLEENTAKEAALESVRSTLWQEYTQNPDNHPNLPNVSYAGYHYGEKAIPFIEGPLYNVKDYGASGCGEVDDGPAIRAALEAVGSEGGVVFIPKGRYRIDGLIFVHKSNTVLRGEDREETVLVFTQPLARAWGVRRLAEGNHLTIAQRAVMSELRELYGDIIPEGPRRRASGWSWSGGLIWFTPESYNTYRDDPHAAQPAFNEGLRGAGVIANLAHPAKRGGRIIHLDADPDFAVGDFIILGVRDPGDLSLAKHLVGDGDWAEAYDWRQNNTAGYPQGLRAPIRYKIEVSAIDGRKITLRQPLRFDMRMEWNPIVVRLGDTIRESGLENMTLYFDRRHEWVSAGHNLYPGWNGPWFNGAINCWMRGVTLVNVDNGPGVSASKLVTMKDFRLTADRPEMHAHHHGTTTRLYSHDNLFTDFQIETKTLHGLNVEYLSSGNVWSRGTLAHGTFDTHRNLPFDNVRTEITINNDGHYGGTGGPLMGKRMVHWNIEVTNGGDHLIAWANAMPQGVIAGLRGVPIRWDAEAATKPVGENVSGVRIENFGESISPSNIYEAQLEFRLNQAKED